MYSFLKMLDFKNIKPRQKMLFLNSQTKFKRVLKAITKFEPLHISKIVLILNKRLIFSKKKRTKVIITKKKHTNKAFQQHYTYEKFMS